MCSFSLTGVLTLLFETAAVPVHVDTDPALVHAAEQNVMAELARANGIIDRLKQTSHHVNHLIRRLRQNPSTDERSAIEDQLRAEYETALYHGDVSVGMVPGLAQMLAHNTVSDIHISDVRHGDSIVVYFLCKTVKAHYHLGVMIVSGFLHAVFHVAIQSMARTTVDVYVRADEFNLRLLCLCSPQLKGSSTDQLFHCDFVILLYLHYYSLQQRIVCQPQQKTLLVCKKFKCFSELSIRPVHMCKFPMLCNTL